MRAFAPGAPPVSGASSRWQPCRATSAPSSRTAAGALVERSTSTLPGAAPRSHASATLRTTAGVGSERKLSSASRATASGPAAGLAPSIARARPAS